MRRDGFWTHIEIKFGKTAANHMHRQQEVITQWNVLFFVRSIKNALQENKMYQNLKLFKDKTEMTEMRWQRRSRLLWPQVHGKQSPLCEHSSSCLLLQTWMHHLLRVSPKFDSVSVFVAPSPLHHPTLILPPSPLPHLSPVFLFTSPLLPFLLVMRGIISQSFYTREATAWLLADVDKGWCYGCQAIQIISGIKRSIASFSKSSPFPDHRSSWVYFSQAE